MFDRRQTLRVFYDGRDLLVVVGLSSEISALAQGQGRLIIEALGPILATVEIPPGLSLTVPAHVGQVRFHRGLGMVSIVIPWPRRIVWPCRISIVPATVPGLAIQVRGE